MTKEQSNSRNWKKLWQNRLTALNFKRVCSRLGNFESLSGDLHKVSNVQTATMKYGLETEPLAAEQYAKAFGRDLFKVGVITNPTCFYLGCSPDRRIFDPDETCNRFGLLEIKSSQVGSIVRVWLLNSSDDMELHPSGPSTNNKSSHTSETTYLTSSEHNGYCNYCTNHVCR